MVWRRRLALLLCAPFRDVGEVDLDPLGHDDGVDFIQELFLPKRQRFHMEQLLTEVRPLPDILLESLYRLYPEAKQLLDPLL